MPHVRGIFHYTQDDTTSFYGTGSRTNCEQVILYYHGVEYNLSIHLNGGMWKSLLEAGLMFGDLWTPTGELYAVGSCTNCEPVNFRIIIFGASTILLIG